MNEASAGTVELFHTLNASDLPPAPDSHLNLAPASLGAAVTAGVAAWVAISAGFLGLKMLMQERPEFVGQPGRVTSVELVQDSPQIVVRKVTDDILVINPAQPELS